MDLDTPKGPSVLASGPTLTGLGVLLFGGVLLSHTPSGAVPSALVGLASGFGMGPGVSLTAMATETLVKHVWCFRVAEWVRSMFVVKPSAD